MCRLPPRPTRTGTLFPYTSPFRAWPDVAPATHLVLVAGQLLGANGAAGVQLAGGNADLGPPAELAAVGELGRGVVHHDAGIDLVQEAGRGHCVLGDDGLGLMEAVTIDMSNPLVEALDHLSGRSPRPL